MDGLGLGQAAVIMPHYPHMLEEDRRVWTRFLETERHRLVRVWYDVRVGGAVDVGSDADELLGRISRGLTRKRIDVVARVGGGYWVIEVKPFGSMLALGQAITYRDLFMREFRPAEEVVGVVVCDKADADMIDEFEAEGIGLWQT